MNADGSELCCDDDIKEQQQQREHNAFFSVAETENSHEINRNEEQQASDGGCPPSPSECGASASVREDVVMEIPTSFPEWSSGATTAAGSMMRRVSFPNDKNLVTGYMEPADPWANGELELERDAN